MIHNHLRSAVDFAVSSFVEKIGGVNMKYVLLFCGTTESQRAWENMPDEVRNQAYARVGKWFEENSAAITGGYELQPPSTATTVRNNGGQPLVTDGPFIEGNEVIGGYAEIEVADLDEALRLAKSWPGGDIVEIRPVVSR
jgi:hypothetical protein